MKIQAGRIMRIGLMLSVVFMMSCESKSEAQLESTQVGEESVTESVYEDDKIPVVTEEVFAMDTYITITCYGEKAQEAANAVVEEIDRLDEILSVGNPESEVSQLNGHKEASLSSDTAAILEEALQIYQETHGAFDITVYPLMDAWGFTTGEYRVPEKSEIAELLKVVGSDQIEYNAETGDASLTDGQGIDLGGIAKGYASDRIMEIFSEYDLASGVVSLGGNVECYGVKPDGNLWRCGIQSPFDTSGLIGILEMADGAAITSGPYERCFTDGTSGIEYHHILDPSTGYPANTGILSVTIVSPNGILADGLSTACYVMGLNGTIEFWKGYQEPFDFIIMTDDEEIYITEGIADQFSSDYPINVVEKVTQ